MGKKNPKSIDDALKDFDSVPKTAKMREEDKPLVEVAKVQSENLKTKDGIFLHKL